MFLKVMYTLIMLNYKIIILNLPLKVSYKTRFKKNTKKDERKYSKFHSNSKTEIFFHNEDIGSAFELFSDMVMTKIQNYQAASSSWFIGSVIEQNINVLKYNFLSGRICINCQKK